MYHFIKLVTRPFIFLLLLIKAIIGYIILCLQKKVRKVTKKLVDPLNFEHALEQLEAIVKNMEGGQLSLEESLLQFEQGTKLSKACLEVLQNAEQKVQILIDNGTTKETTNFLLDSES